MYFGNVPNNENKYKREKKEKEWKKTILMIIGDGDGN